eukprot:12897468-Prorocentrum_lima.AAC.1
MTFATKRVDEMVDCYIHKRLRPDRGHSDIPKDAFIECRGRVARNSAKYPVRLARLFWDTVKVERTAGHGEID